MNPEIFHIESNFFIKRIILIILISEQFINCYSQDKLLEIISTSGGSFINSKMQISWTIGEPVIETFKGGSLYLTQGFHQSDLIITELDGLHNLNVNILAYPNPASEFVQLRIESSKDEKMDCQLLSMDGKLLVTGKIINNQASISVKNLARSAYILKVMNSKGEFKAFRIIKK